MIKMDDNDEVLRAQFHDHMSGDDDEYLPCAHCEKTFCPDYAETFKLGNHIKGYKCPHCEGVTY